MIVRSGQKAYTVDETARLCAGWGAQGSVLVAEVPNQTNAWELNLGCRDRAIGGQDHDTPTCCIMQAVVLASIGGWSMFW